MEEIIFSKFSNERADRFSIRTDILLLDGVKKIRKVPDKPEAMNHVLKLWDTFVWSENAYDSQKIAYNVCEKKENSVYFEFLTGVSLEEELFKLVKNKEYDKVVERIKEYKEMLFGNLLKKDFIMSDGFKEVFGDASFSQKEESIDHANIDLIFSNVIINDKWNIIDYEWTFDFLIPVNFIVYRAIEIFIINSRRNKALREYDIFGKVGITKEEMDAFAVMEQNFQRFVRDERYTLTDMHHMLGNKTYDVKELTNKERPLMIQVFFDCGEGYSEETSRWIEAKVEASRIILILKDVPEGAISIRIDPSEKMCRVSKISIKGKNGEISYTTNASYEWDNVYYFTHVDPQIIISKDGCDVDMVEYDYSELDRVVFNHIDVLNMKINEYEEKMRLLQAELTDVTNEKDNWITEYNNVINSKSYKVTKPLRAVKKMMK